MQARSMAAVTGAGSSLVALVALTGVAVVFFFPLAVVAPGVAAETDAAAPAPAPAPAGFEFRVGGPRGWRVPDANTSYGWWATNNRFHVGDRLYFKYDANDSVLLVDRGALDACNATDPLAAFTDGATRFRLNRPGFFCFISGEPGHCEQGQRLVVRVMVHQAGGATAPTVQPCPEPGHGGAGQSRPSGCPDDASSGSESDAAIAVAAGVASTVAVATLVAAALLCQ